MKSRYFTLFVFLMIPKLAGAWGHHDLIPELSCRRHSSGVLNQEFFTPPREFSSVAGKLLKDALPPVHNWSESYHTQFDRRYSWTRPPDPAQVFGSSLSETKQFLWEIQGNIDTRLETFELLHEDESILQHLTCERLSTKGEPAQMCSASKILEIFSEEPDGMLDSQLNQPWYWSTFKSQMAPFHQEQTDPHTHSFRHLFQPKKPSVLIYSDYGTAPYRAGLYAELAIQALRQGHDFWGLRFLARSLHYVQDITQPFHTIRIPRASFLFALLKKGGNHSSREIPSLQLGVDCKCSDAQNLRRGIH